MRNIDTSEEVPDFLYGKQSICMTKAIRKYEIMDVKGKKTKLQFLYNYFRVQIISKFINIITLSFGAKLDYWSAVILET